MQNKMENFNIYKISKVLHTILFYYIFAINTLNHHISLNISKTIAPPSILFQYSISYWQTYLLKLLPIAQLFNIIILFKVMPAVLED